MFHSWLSGGTVCAMTDADGFNRIAFARERRIESWYSVPSVVALAARSGWLTPNALRDLKFSLFAGEALPTSLARQWMAAAPASQGFNLYGPTEATVTVTGYAFTRARLDRLVTATVPIGNPNPGSEVVIVGADGEPVADGGMGELWLGGPQVVPGYLHNPLETASKFVARSFAGKASTRWYRSGDLVQPTAEHGLLYLGRNDDQVKIAGYRVELFDVEEALRQAAGSPEAAAVPWPLAADGAAEGLVGFVTASTRPLEDIRHDCVGRLPTYMVPSQVIVVDQLPLNSSGKVDRARLRALYLERREAPIAVTAPTAKPADPEAELIACWSKLFPGQTITPDTSFASLGGDSLTYVNTMLATEDIIGALDDGWVKVSVAGLAARANATTAGGHGLDAASIVRAGALLVIVSEHLHVIPQLGGDLGPLMLVSGFLFGLLPFAKYRESGDRRALLQPLWQLVLITALITFPQAILAWSPTKIFDLMMVDDIVSGWHRPAWFVHALVHLMLLFWVVSAVLERVKAKLRPSLDVSLATAGAVLAVGAIAGFVMPFVLPHFNDADPWADAWWRYEPLGQAFIFAAGVLIAVAHRRRRGAIAVGLVAVWAVMSVALNHTNDAVATLGAAVLLTYLARLRVPAIIAKPIYAVADASLFIYLLQFPMINGMNAIHLPIPPVVRVVVIVSVSVGLWRVWLAKQVGTRAQMIVERSFARLWHGARLRPASRLTLPPVPAPMFAGSSERLSDATRIVAMSDGAGSALRLVPALAAAGGSPQPAAISPSRPARGSPPPSAGR